MPSYVSCRTGVCCDELSRLPLFFDIFASLHRYVTFLALLRGCVMTVVSFVMRPLAVSAHPTTTEERGGGKLFALLALSLLTIYVP